ncbi:MAG TPA: SH3 domain-containing protein [Candidatus Eisenbergiella intestinipullorum]|nr:SH3 domain-containing protein [Candidatus Eisenbergiella intestinipullorum]
MSEERKKDEEGRSVRQEQEMQDFRVQPGPGRQKHSLPWWKELAQILGKNKKSLASVIAAAVVLLGAGVFLGAMIGRHDTAGQTALTETQTAQAESQTSGTEAAYAPLEENAYPEINALIEKYYQAAAAGDIDTINSIKDYSEQTELLQIKEKSKYLEGYEDINCYTKPGPQEDSYVVYASYYAKFKDIDRPVCGLNTFVVCRNGEGEYYIHDCTNDETMREYRISVTKQDDVVELFNKVQVEYNEAVTEDEELAAFLTSLSEDLKASVGDALAELETETQTEGQTETETEGASETAPAEETAQEESTETENAGEGSLVEAVDVVNIRSSDSETADVLGKAQPGDTFPLLENRENGWSKVEYDGGEAFIKSEYLAAAEESAGDASDSSGQEESPAGEASEEEAEAAGDDGQDDAPAAGEASEGADLADVPNSGTYRLTTTVNIRSSASESADRIAVGYSGDEVEILMKQADGWTKVRFDGEVGYIRTDVLR